MIRFIATAEEALAAHAGTLAEIRRPVEGLPSAPQNVRYLAGSYLKCDATHSSEAVSLRIQCPLGAPGDLLFVAEAWAAHWMYDDVPPADARSPHPGDNYWYRAAGEDSVGSCGCPAAGRRGRWRDADTMPIAVSRAWLRNLGVRVERVGDVWTWVVQVEAVMKDGKPVRPAEAEKAR